MADFIFSLIVPVTVIAMVLITRRVALSLLVGIVLGGIMLHYNAPIDIFKYSVNKITDVFYSGDSGVNLGSIYIFSFLVLLGVLSQVILYSGAINAFVIWAHKRVNTSRTSEFMAFIAGIVIFIDDYFNTLTVGQVSKSLNDANKSSRERLAYIIDSTSAPICILMPISSWGAYSIGILDRSIPKDYGDGFILLANSIFSNYYAWFALVGVFLTILWQLNLPAMQRNINIGVVDNYNDRNSIVATSSIWLLIVPVVTLVISISLMIFYTGTRYKAQMLCKL